MRLRASRDFRRVQGRGQKVRQTDLLLLYLPGQTPQSRIGLTVSRKVGNAVIRNQVKRRLREGLRHVYDHLQGRWDVVVIAHPSAAAATAESLWSQLTAGLSRLDTPAGRGRRG